VLALEVLIPGNPSVLSQWGPLVTGDVICFGVAQGVFPFSLLAGQVVAWHFLSP
jgi:hypothetical protein